MRRLLALLAAPALALAQERTHVVAEGDTVTALASRFGVSGSAILAANGLRSAVLIPGQRLTIPAGDAADAREVDPPIPRAEPARVARAEVVNAPPEPEREDSPPPPAEPPRLTGFAEAIALPASAGVRYNGRWVPPGERSAWVMDCSNTARWLHREVRGITLPRTASDQYEWLRARGRLWRTGADEDRLRRRLQPGDLLFWENTYRPVRRPPITHVMVYLGTDARGRMRMAGSQGASGVDTYDFQPGKKMGGYRFFFFFRRDGRFVAYGRP